MTETVNAAVILAGGSGTRMGKAKQWVTVAGKTVLEHTISAFAACGAFSFYVIVVRPCDKGRAEDLCALLLPKGRYAVTTGGDTRTASAIAGFACVPPAAAYIAVHDAARCAVHTSLILEVLAAAHESGAAAAATRITDTVKQTDCDGLIAETVNRETLVCVETPQIFSRGLYARGIEKAVREGYSETDDCGLVQRLGEKITPVFSSFANPKLTYDSDMRYIEYLLAGHSPQKKEASTVRIGHGYDVHRLTEGRKLILGGVDIPFEKGLLGHSDADVLTHAIMDALLGAAGLPDIGQLFPDNDEAYRGADSLVLLADVAGRLRAAGFRVLNVDATLVAQSPKLSPYLADMKKKIAAAIGHGDHVVNVKATTEEHLGFTGSGEGIAAHAVCLLSF